MADSFQGGDLTIYFLDMTTYNTVASAADWTANAGTLTASTYVKDIQISGGDQDTNTETFFSDAQLTFKSGRKPTEIKMTVRIPTDSTNVDVWEGMFLGSGLTSAGLPEPQIIGLSATDPASNVKKAEYKNATMTKFEPKFSADSYWQADVTFEVPATDSTGAANYTANATFLHP